MTSTMTNTLTLPRADGSVEQFALSEPRVWAYPRGPFRTRVAYAAAHVVADPRRDVDVFTENAIDWEATLAYRRHLWKYGFAIAEAMDTAQRGGGLTWKSAQELIRRSQVEANSVGGTIAFGAGTDHLLPTPSVTLDDVRRAYEEQVGYVESVGGRVILMASRALAKAARSADDYRAMYGGVLRQVSQPVILHWLGDMFDPQLAGPKALGGPVSLQVWRRDPTGVLERAYFGPGPAYSEVLRVWVFVKGHQLALAFDREGERQLYTLEEKERSEKERERSEKERERSEKERERAEKERERTEKERERTARIELEQRVAELERKLQ